MNTATSLSSESCCQLLTRWALSRNISLILQMHSGTMSSTALSSVSLCLPWWFRLVKSLGKKVAHSIASWLLNTHHDQAIALVLFCNCMQCLAASRHAEMNLAGKKKLVFSQTVPTLCSGTVQVQLAEWLALPCLSKKWRKNSAIQSSVQWTSPNSILFLLQV